MNLSYSKSLRRLSKLVSFSTLFLIYLGALVKSFEVGLSVPDWPTTYGDQMFSFPFSDMVGGIFYEHGHRLFATWVGFLTLMQAIFLGFSKEQLWIKKLGFFALAIVICQGLLGGITVLFFLPPAISIFHGVLAQTFFTITIIIAYSLSRARSNRSMDIFKLRFRKMTIFLFGLVYAKLILGALMRHTSSGLAIPDFPTMGGLWIPTFTEKMVNNINVTLFDLDLEMISKWQVVIHFFHRLGAFVITSVFAYFIYRYRKIIKHNLVVRKFILIITFIVIAQITLGVATILSVKNPYIASFHVATGACLLGVFALFILNISPLKIKNWLL